jgi:hypothetical protein
MLKPLASVCLLKQLAIAKPPPWQKNAALFQNGCVSLVERKASENCFCFQHKNNRSGGSWPITITITEAPQILIHRDIKIRACCKNPGRGLA